MPYADPLRAKTAGAQASAHWRRRAQAALALLREIAQAQPPVPAEDVQDRARAILQAEDRRHAD